MSRRGTLPMCCYKVLPAHLLRRQVEDIFDSLDINKDGEITFSGQSACRFIPHGVNYQKEQREPGET